MFCENKKENTQTNRDLSKVKSQNLNNDSFIDSGDLDDFIFKDVTPKYVSER